LFLHGGLDRVVPSSHSQWLARRCPSAELRLSPHDGHISVLNSSADALGWLRERADLRADLRSRGQQAPYQSQHAPPWRNYRAVTARTARGSGLRGQPLLGRCSHRVMVPALHQVVLKGGVHRGLLAVPA
jgi:hypothetical protein